jgi:hypothetical protein
MAFLLSHSVFVHIPKSAGQWVAQTLNNAGLIVGTLGVVHASPDEIRHELAFQQRSIVFTIVRHPLSWYQSIWVHRMNENWLPMDDPNWFTPRWMDIWAEFTKHCQASRFDEFVRKCITYFPNGFVSTLYEVYTEGCSFVGKQERLVEDLLKVLKLAGEQFQPASIYTMPPKNVRARQPHWSSLCTYTPPLIDLTMQTEANAIERFGYQHLPRGIIKAAEPASLCANTSDVLVAMRSNEEAGEATRPSHMKGEEIEWMHRLSLTAQDIAALIPRGNTFILVDQDHLRDDLAIAERRVIPFLERYGRYWGPPPDDETAIRELERLRRAGARFMIFAWPAFWWLDYYSELRHYLHTEFPCMLHNDRLIVFDLQAYQTY